MLRHFERHVFTPCWFAREIVFSQWRTLRHYIFHFSIGYLLLHIVCNTHERCSGRHLLLSAWLSSRCLSILEASPAFASIESAPRMYIFEPERPIGHGNAFMTSNSPIQLLFDASSGVRQRTYGLCPGTSGVHQRWDGRVSVRIVQLHRSHMTNEVLYMISF